MKGLTGAFFVCVAAKGLSSNNLGKAKSVWVFFIERLGELGEADFKSFVFVCMASKGLTGAFFVCVAGKGLSGKEVKEVEEVEEVKEGWVG